MKHGTITTYRKHKCRCDECRAANAASQAAFQARYRDRTGLTYHAVTKRRTRGQEEVAVKLCARCGEPVQKARLDPGVVSMHTACRRAAEEDARRSRILPARRRAPRLWLGSVLPTPRRVWTVGACEWCDGRLFSYGRRVRFCSSQCQKSSQTARRGKFAIRPARRLALYERDEWRCWLCLAAVDGSLPVTHPRSATLDHVRPQSWDEVPDHSDANLRLAHRDCNGRRGDLGRHLERLERLEH